MDFEIFFSDLTEDCQERMCKAFKTEANKENWDVIPVAMIPVMED